MAISKEDAVKVAIPVYKFRSQWGTLSKLARAADMDESTLRRKCKARVAKQKEMPEGVGHLSGEIVTPAEEVNGETIVPKSTSARPLDTNEEDNENQRQVS